MNTILAIQTALIAAGYNPGPEDGIIGRLTLKAVELYRSQIGLPPGGIDQALIDRLILDNPPPPPPSEASWYTLAWRKLGQHEAIHNSKLSRFLRFDGNTLGDPSRQPWCGDFVETCIAITLPDETLPSTPYAAQSWAAFGDDITEQGPRLGAVLVFWRGSPTSWKGHVGFYNGETENTYSVLGGNQSNRVSITEISKDRLLSIRWPATFPYEGPAPRTVVTRGEVSPDEA